MSLRSNERVGDDVRECGVGPIPGQLTVEELGLKGLKVWKLRSSFYRSPTGYSPKSWISTRGMSFHMVGIE